MVADTRTDYQIATEDYEAARDAAAKKIKMIADVSSALQSRLQSFIGWQYGKSMQTSQYDKKAQFDMSEWPDAELLKAALIAWHDAFNRLHREWDVKGKPERVACLPPPKEMTTS